MAKTVNISESKFNDVLRKIVTEVFDGVENNYEPFESQDDDHDEGIVGDSIDPTVYDKNGNMAIENP